VTLDGRTRMQLNFLVTKSSTLSDLVDFKDGAIVPILWAEAVSIPSIADLILLEFKKVSDVS
jgi:hypothetical protein